MDEKELKRMIKEVFHYYKSDLISKKEFEEYFRSRGLSDSEIEQLWLKAHTHEIITIGIDPITEEVMFELKKKMRRII